MPLSVCLAQCRAFNVTPPMDAEPEVLTGDVNNRLSVRRRVLRHEGRTAVAFMTPPLLSCVKVCAIFSVCIYVRVLTKPLRLSKAE